MHIVMEQARAYFLERGMVPVANNTAAYSYDRAVEAFAAGGSRSALMCSLMALGVPADIVRWHGDYPGNRMQTATLDGLITRGDVKT